MCATLPLKTWLEGEWILSRKIQDLKDSRSGTMAGKAYFLPFAEDLFYKESILVELEAYKGYAERSYRYCFPSPLQADVYFMDGQPFHTLDLSTGHAQVIHKCRKDIYYGDFEMIDLHLFRYCWKIEGPRKKLEIRTQLKKAP